MITWIAMGAIAAMAVAILGLGGVVWARLSGYGRAAAKEAYDPSFTQARGFTVERYEPLTRLLAGDDVEFLRQQHGCPKIVAQWKRARVRIVRLYLNDLASDFRCLHAEARALTAESPEQYSELVGVLLRQQLTFWRVMADAELRLTLGWLGLERINARRLVEEMTAMQVEITRTIAPIPV